MITKNSISMGKWSESKIFRKNSSSKFGFYLGHILQPGIIWFHKADLYDQLCGPSPLTPYPGGPLRPGFGVDSDWVFQVFFEAFIGLEKNKSGTRCQRVEPHDWNGNSLLWQRLFCLHLQTAVEIYSPEKFGTLHHSGTHCFKTERNQRHQRIVHDSFRIWKWRRRVHTKSNHFERISSLPPVWIIDMILNVIL